MFSNVGAKFSASLINLFTSIIAHGNGPLCMFSKSPKNAFTVICERVFGAFAMLINGYSVFESRMPEMNAAKRCLSASETSLPL